MSQQPVPVRPTPAFVGASWVALVIAVTAFAVGLWNADMLLSEKGFYGLGYTMALFAVIAVQKNIRDLAAAGPAPRSTPAEPEVTATVWQQ